MLLSDLSEVMRIEAGAYSYPWSRGIFRDCLRVGYCCWVGEGRGIIESYCIMSAVVEEAHVLNICVRRSAQGRGYGRATLQHLLALARRRDVKTVTLEVRPSNRVAIALYASLGFEQVGLRRAYYPARGGREDALILTCDLASMDDATARSVDP